MASGASVQKQINEKSGRALVVADNIAHENIQNVIVDRNDAAETGHRAILSLYR